MKVLQFSNEHFSIQTNFSIMGNKIIHSNKHILSIFLYSIKSFTVLKNSFLVFNISKKITTATRNKYINCNKSVLSHKIPLTLPDGNPGGGETNCCWDIWRNEIGYWICKCLSSTTASIKEKITIFWILKIKKGQLPGSRTAVLAPYFGVPVFRTAGPSKRIANVQHIFSHFRL